MPIQPFIDELVKAKKAQGTCPRSCTSPLAKGVLNPDPSILPHSFHCTTVAFPKLYKFKKLKSQLIILMFFIIQIKVTTFFFFGII